MEASPRRLIYQVAVGQIPDYYRTCINSVSRYARRIGAEHLVQTEATLRIAPKASARSENAMRLGYLPIFEKENAFRFLEIYDQVLILDADVFIRIGAPNIFEQSRSPFAGVVERDIPVVQAHRRKLAKHSDGQFGNLRDVEWHWNELGAEFFNMGVMLLDQSLLPWLRGQSPKEFLERPEFERFVNGEGHWKWSTDQTLLNWWLKAEQIPTIRLDWRWNALFGVVLDVMDAYFVHFFLAAKLPRGGAEIPKIASQL